MAAPPMLTLSVTRSSNKNLDSNVTYTIKLTQGITLSPGNILSVTFPAEIGLDQATCTDLASNDLIYMRAGQKISATLASTYLGGAEFGVIVSGIFNPPSFAPLS